MNAWELPVWIVQRCVDPSRHTYENFPGYELPLTLKEVTAALDELERLYPNQDFRGTLALRVAIPSDPGTDKA